MSAADPSVRHPNNEPGKIPTSEDVRAIGEIIRDTRNLSPEQVAQILEYQRTNGVKFGEAAIALNYATTDDVLHALAQQFNYAVGGEERQRTSPELVALNQPFSRQAEVLRAIRAQITLRTQPDAQAGVTTRKALAVVSPNTGDGKTFFCANLAIALSQAGGRTLVVDADMRGPRLHEVFGIESKVGLSTLLAGRRGESVIKVVKGVPNLFVMPVGVSPPNPMELVEGPAFGLLLMELLTKFDHVIVDTPAAEYGADSAVVAARCGTALIIARNDSSRVNDLQDLVETLSATTVKLLGVIMNEF